MNWTRRHVDGKDSDHYKEWRAGRNRYRITWRDQAFRVAVPPGYHSCVRVFVPGLDCPMWDFVDQRRHSTYRTFKAAKDACERHADPDYKPVRKKKGQSKRKAPMKTCSQCGAKVHVRKALCVCGYKFPKKVKR